MEQQNETQNTSLFDLQVDNVCQSYLMETAKWGKFLAIIGFIGCGLLVLIALFAGTAISSLSSTMGGPGAGFGGLITVFYILFALLYFFPLYYLYNFSVKMQAAIRSNDQSALQAALANQKSCYKFVGILTIVVLSLYLLAFFAALIFASSLRGY
jgi:hypothetical protein